MTELQSLLQELLEFRDARDWAQFHDSRNLALALSIEAAELNELFLWKKEGEAPDPELLKEELADVLSYALLLAHENQLDLPEIIRTKMKKNATKYPIEKAKGSATKYDQL